MTTQARPTHTIHYTVDGEPQVTEHQVLTANQILQHAGIDAATHYLVEIEGKHQKSFEGRGDEPINLHDKATFISVFNGPTPVS